MKKLREHGIRALDWLERLIQTDVRYLAKGGFWLGMGQFVATGTAFLLSLAFANLLPRETYGVYRYILSIGALLTIPTLSGMDSAVTRAVARGYEGSIVEAMKTKLRWGMLTTLAGLGLGGYYFINGNSTLAIGFGLAAICIPLWESFDIYSSFLNGKKLFNKYAQYYGMVQIFAGVSIFCTLLLTQNIIAILLAYFLSNMLIRVVFFRHIITTLHPNKEKDLETISYGKHLSLMDVIGTVLGQLDKILIFHYLGAADVALFSIAIAPSENVKGILKNIHTLALPRFASRTKEDVKSKIFDKAWKLGVLITGITIVFIFLVPPFFHIFFPKYLDAIRYAQVISISLVGASVSMFLYTFLESHAQKSALYKFNIYSNIINIVIVFVMIYYFGLWGAIFARIIVRTLLLIFSVYLVKNS